MNNNIWHELEKFYKEYTSLKLEDAIDFKKFSLFSNVHHSTAIEGSTLTEAQTEILLEKGLTAAGKPIEHSLMVKDCYNALLFSDFESKKGIKLSVGLLQEINSMVMKNTGSLHHHISGDFDTSKGEYRTCAVFAQGGSYYPSHEKIASSVKNFMWKGQRSSIKS